MEAGVWATFLEMDWSQRDTSRTANRVFKRISRIACQIDGFAPNQSRVRTGDTTDQLCAELEITSDNLTIRMLHPLRVERRQLPIWGIRQIR
jgi:hypothetical protein